LPIILSGPRSTRSLQGRRSADAHCGVPGAYVGPVNSELDAV